MPAITETPVEVLAGVAIAVIVKVRSSLTLGWVGSLTTVAVATLAGLFLYAPVLEVTGLDQRWDVFVAIIVSLIAEGVMKSILDFATKPDAFAKLVALYWTRDPSVLSDDKKEEK